MTTPVRQWSATSLAQNIRDRDVTSEEAVRAHIDRIEAVNSEVNAVTVILDECALHRARQADAEIASGKAVGPLHGVPFTVKEVLDVVGSATTHAPP